MFSFWKRQERPAHRIDEATREEILKLLAEMERSRKSRFPRLALLLKMGSGYVAMAVFTIAALVFSSFTLYGIYNTARDIVKVELPAMHALNKLRGSLLAQERFAGKYAILRDPAFIDLFRQREKETLANLAVLEKAGLDEDVEVLKSRYQDYEGAAARLFASSSASEMELRPLNQKLLSTVDEITEKRQDRLQGVLTRADYLRESTVKWTITISCLGFVLAIVVAIAISSRIYDALKRLQTATHHLASGDFHIEPVSQAGAELIPIAGDFAKIAERLRILEGILEQMKKNTPQVTSTEAKLPEKTERTRS